VRNHRWAVALLATVGALSGCSSGRPLAGASPSATASNSPTPSPAARLVTLAEAGAGAHYVAHYILRHPHGTAAGTVVIYRAAGSIRVDIGESGHKVIAIFTPHGAYSCVVASGHTTCFVAARPGQKLPSYLDPALERVFTTFLTDLATSPGVYSVTADGSTPAAGSVPAGSCFQIGPAPGDAAAPPVTPGRYCLAASGVVTLVRFGSGVLDLASLTGPPTGRQLQPPASPTPLP